MDARTLAMAVEPTAPALTGGIARISPRVWRIVAPNPSALTGPGTNTYVVGRNRPVVIDPTVVLSTSLRAAHRSDGTTPGQELRVKAGSGGTGRRA